MPSKINKKLSCQKKSYPLKYFIKIVKHIRQHNEVLNFP